MIKNLPGDQMRRDEMMEGALKVEEVEQKRRWKSMVGVFLLLFFPMARRVCLKCRPVIATGSSGNPRAKESNKVTVGKRRRGETSSATRPTALCHQGFMIC